MSTSSASLSWYLISKRVFDFVLSLLLLIFLIVPMGIVALVLFFDLRSSPFFLQERIGQYGNKFTLFKFRTIHPRTGTISKLGRFFRRSKLDELPQLIHILLGAMSFVGPRPDVPGYYDTLTGTDRVVLELKPGLTSEASLLFFNEEALLAQQVDPLVYNDTVLFPQKVAMNLRYYYERTFLLDLRLLLRTIFVLF